MYDLGQVIVLEDRDLQFSGVRPNPNSAVFLSFEVAEESQEVKMQVLFANQETGEQEALQIDEFTSCLIVPTYQGRRQDDASFLETLRQKLAQHFSKKVNKVYLTWQLAGAFPEVEVLVVVEGRAYRTIVPFWQVAQFLEEDQSIDLDVEEVLKQAEDILKSCRE